MTGMTRVAWSTYDGSDIEHVVAMLLCRENPSATVIRPASGDGGIDIKVPTEEPGVFDIYQVKKFAENLKPGQKTQIKKSLARLKKTVEQDASFKVRNWYLTMPLDPTPGNTRWFDETVEDVDWDCEWRGFNFVDGLAATYPEVIDYYLHNDRERLRETTDALAAAFGAPQTSGDEPAVVTPASVFGQLKAIQALLDTDPHFAYDIHLDNTRPRDFVDAPTLVASVQVGYVDRSRPCLSVNVHARFAEAVNERSIPLNFEIKVEPGTKLHEDLRLFQKYGTPFTAPEGTVSGTVGLPGGLGGDFENGALHILDASGERYDLRLQVRDDSYVLLAEVLIHMEPVTTGFDRSGVRAHGKDDASVFEFELLTDLDAGKTDLSFTKLDASGKPPAAVLEPLRLLAAVKAPNQLVMALPQGPVEHAGLPLDRTTSLWPDLDLDDLVRVVEDLKTIQDSTSVQLLVPEELTLYDTNSIRNSARLLRGDVIRRKPMRTPHICSVDIPDGGALSPAVIFSVPFAPTIAGQQLDFGELWYVCTDVTFDSGSVVEDEEGRPCAQADPGESSVMWMQFAQPAPEDIAGQVAAFTVEQSD